MMSRSSSSKGLARDGVRRSLWAVVLSTLAFVVSMLLPSLMNMQQALEDRKGMIVDGARASELAQSWKSSLADAAIYIGGENALVKLAVILLAVVAGTAMFAYLHDKRKVDFYHSLPISREKLYLVNFVTGAVCVIAPYLVLRVLTLVCAHAMGFGEAVSVGTYLGVILCDILFFLLLYAMSALSTILCGNTIIALLLQLWVYLAPLAIQMMHEGLLSLYCKTYDSMSYSDLFNHLRLSPAATYFMVNGANYGSGLADNFIRAGKPAYMLLAEYAAAALFIIALGVFAFRRRKSERAGTALAFRPLRLPVKAFMCIVMGTAFAIGFRLIGGKFWLWPGLVFGTVLFHCIIEVIYAFDLRALVKHPVQMLAILAVTALLMVGMQKDVLGYDRWLPDESKVASAGLIDYGDSAAELTEKENIAALCRLAEIGREATLNADSNDTGTAFLESHSLQFAMQNGTVKTRSYKLPVSEEVRSLLNKVYGSSEYKLKSSSLYDLDLDNARVTDMTFCVNQLKYNSETITDGEKAAEIVKTLREERLTYTELAKPVMSFNITTDAEANNYANGIVTDRDVKTLALIKKYFGLEPQSIAPDTVSQVELDFYVPGEDTWVGLNVTDRADIAALLKDAVATGTMRMYGNSDFYDLISFKDNARVNVTPAVEDGCNYYEISYPYDSFPTSIVEKYRPAAEKLAADPYANAATAAGDIMVTRSDSLG